MELLQQKLDQYKGNKMSENIETFNDTVIIKTEYVDREQFIAEKEQQLAGLRTEFSMLQTKIAEIEKQLEQANG